MAKCDPQIFPDFTPECLGALRGKIQAHGVDASLPTGQTSGVASRAGFEITWSYNTATATLTVQCTGSPFFAPCSVINAQINSWISSCYDTGRPRTDLA